MMKTFLGFGLGAVQSGLMLLEAVRSNHFDQYYIIEVNPELVKAVRENNHSITVNTAKEDGIIKNHLTDIQIYDPNNPNDRKAINQAIHNADEMTTAIPSVHFYESGENSIAVLLAENINMKKYQILYASENHNYAAELLTEAIQRKLSSSRSIVHFQALNTVIGKMGGVIQDPKTINELGLTTMVPGYPNAILVEAFNHIIVSQVRFPIQRGIDVFIEKSDLLPFEEAKLYGHNAVHSLLGYLAALKGYVYMSEIRDDAALYAIGEQAFQIDCGSTLLKKYSGFDPFFTPDEFECYGTDLLKRMTNPWLHDEVARVCRDPVRKMRYSDRFFGTMCEAFKQGVEPKIIAKGAIAGLYYIMQHKFDLHVDYPTRITDLTKECLTRLLNGLWENDKLDEWKDECVDLVWDAHRQLADEW